MAADSATDIGWSRAGLLASPRASLVPVPDNSEKAVISERHAACAITLPKSSMAVRLTTLMYRVTAICLPKSAWASVAFRSELLNDRRQEALIPWVGCAALRADVDQRSPRKPPMARLY